MDYKVWIKICGITNIADAIEISDLGADALGFILSTDSPRRISEEKVGEIISGLKKYCSSVNKKIPSLVGVFVNEKIERISKLMDRKIFDFIQLSGDEKPDYISTIKNYYKDVKIIKAIKVPEFLKSGSVPAIPEMISSFKEVANFFLIDTFEKKIYGGTGKSFDWSFLKDLGKNFPVIIAGGLDAGNVRRAVDIIKPFGVDASTRLEEFAGKKDLKKTENFINEVRGV